MYGRAMTASSLKLGLAQAAVQRIDMRLCQTPHAGRQHLRESDTRNAASPSSDPGSDILYWLCAQHASHVRDSLAPHSSSALHYSFLRRSSRMGHGYRGSSMPQPGRTPSARCRWNHSGVLRSLQVRAMATLMGRTNTQATTISTPCACTQIGRHSTHVQATTVSTPCACTQIGRHSTHVQATTVSTPCACTQIGKHSTHVQATTISAPCACTYTGACQIASKVQRL